PHCRATPRHDRLGCHGPPERGSWPRGGGSWRPVLGGGQAGEVVGGVAEQVGAAVRAFEVEVGVVLPGDRDAAVELDHLGGGGVQGFGAVDLGDGGGYRVGRGGEGG